MASSQIRQAGGALLRLRAPRTATAATPYGHHQHHLHQAPRLYYHRTFTAGQPYKDSQDRQSLKPRKGETSQSGSDDAAAHEAESAFDPHKTRPEEEKAAADRNTKGGENPLEVSPANEDVSDPGGGKKEVQGGPGDTSDTQQGRSGGGRPEKKGRYEGEGA